MLLQKKKSNLVGDLFGKAPFKKAIFPEKLLGLPKYVTFENAILPIPEFAHEYLTISFGDYMKIPSADEIKIAKHAEIIDLSKDYSEYLKRI